MSENVLPPTPPTDGTPTDPQALPPRKKKRWWLRILIAVPLLLIVLVLLAPTILSLGFVRSMVLSSFGKSATPNGKLDVTSWSFGWFSGQHVDGITLYDDQNAAVAHLNVKTDASLLSLIRGNYALGDTTVTGDFDARIDSETGRVNLLHIVGADPKAPESAKPSEPNAQSKSPAKAEPTPRAPAVAKSDKLPIDLNSIKGKLTLNLTGTVSAANGDKSAIPFTKISTGSLVVDLNDIEHGVPIDGTLKLVVNDKPATLAIKGTADAVEKNAIITDPNKIAADLTATIEQLDLSVVKAALAAAGKTDVDVAGVLKGKLIISAKPGAEATIRSEDNLGIDNLVVTAPQLQGDTFTSKRVDFPIDIARNAGNGDIKINAFGMKTDLATFGITGTVPALAVTNLSATPIQSPGATGTIAIKADVPSFAAVATMLPHATYMKDGVTITGGGLSQTATIDLLTDGVKVGEALAINIDGTKDGKPIKLDKTTLNATADVAIANGQALDATALLKAVRSLTLNVVAPFAKIDGGGVPEKVQLAGNVDLTKFYDDVSQFVDMGKLDLKGTTNFTLATAGLPKDGGDAVGATLGFSATGLTVTNDAQGLLNNENVKGDINLLLKQTGDLQTITFKKLAISTDSGLFGLWTAGEQAWVSVKGGMPVAGIGEFHVRGKLEQLAAPFAASVDPSMKLKRGLLDSTITFALDQAKQQTNITTDTSLTKLDVGDILGNETLKISSTSLIPADLSAANNTFEVASSFVTVKGDADVLLAKPDKSKPSVFEMARSVNFTGSVPSLPKLYALANSLAPAAAPAKGAVVLPPLKVQSGSVAFDGKVTRDDAKGVTSVAFNVPAVSDLALARGDATFRQAQPITVAFAADVSTDTTKATVTEQLKRVLISKLDASIPGIAKVTMPQPIEVTNLDQPMPSANGTISADGNLQPLGEFLAVVNGSNPLPVAGTFATQQKIATTGDQLAVTGTGTLDALQPTGKDAQKLPAHLQTVELTNDLSLDTKAKSATIKTFSLTAPKAKDVLSLNASGTIRDLGTKNTFDGLIAKIAYDLPELWPLAQPFVDPTGESIGKIENLKGKYAKTFNIAGSYPTVDAKGKPILFNDSVRTLDVAGDLQIDSAYLADKGVEVQNLSIPITLKNGILTIANADGSLPKDFDVNSGKGRLAGIAVDLTGPEPVLPKLDKLPLVTNATLNPIMSNALGKFFNPVFPNATKAKALVTVIVTADHLKLGKSLTTKDSGSATVVLSLTDMEISNPLGEQLLGGLVNKASGALDLGGGLDTSDFSNFRGEMKGATFVLNHGVVTQNATFMLGSVDDKTDPKAKPKELYPFTFGGDVTLSTLAMNLDAGFPMGLVKSKAKGDVLKVLEFLPDQLKVGFGGTTTTPKLNFNDAKKQFGDAFVKFGASKLAGDKSGDGKKGDKVEDILGGLLGGKKKDKSDDSEKKATEDKQPTNPQSTNTQSTPDNADRPSRAEQARIDKRAADAKAAADAAAAAATQPSDDDQPKKRKKK